MQRKLVEKLLLVVVMVVLCMAVDMTASALEPTGQCGDDVYWTFDETTGELVISGEGDMWDYRDPETASTKISPFENSQEIKSIIIEDGISSIGAKSFWGCQTLENVVIAESVTNIFDYAFAYCSNLVEFDFSNALKTLGEGSFHNCTNLNNVVLPESLTSIEPLVFQFCTSLESIIIPANVTNIYYCAFNGCVGLKTVILSKELTDIGESAFLSCASLEEIIVPGKVQNISDYAFSGCTSLEKVILPKSLNGLNVGTFNWCFSLNEVILPESIGEIKEYNFYNCISLKKAICENKELIFDGEEIYSIDLVLDENITISEFTEKSKAYICSMAKLDEVSNAYQNNSELVQKYEEEFNKAAIEMENCLTMLDEPRPIDDLILYGHTHSTTESYAIANNIPFTALEGSEHPDKYFATDWTVCPLWPLGNSPK